MIVEEIMVKEVHSIQKDCTIKEAIELMDKYKIRHLPIVDNNENLVGIITERDLKGITIAQLQQEAKSEVLNLPVEEVMEKDPLTGHPLDFIEDIALLFYEKKIGCLPIVKKGKIVGIVTGTDLLRAFIELTGVHQPGSQIEIRVRNKPGMLFKILSDIQNCKVNILSVFVYPDLRDEDYKIVALRIQTMNPLSLIEILETEGHEVLWPNLPGMEA